MLHEMYDGLMIMDYFDDCIVGVIKGIDNKDKVCYSYKKVIAKLMRDDEMSEEDAIEHFEFNMIGAYVGEHTPVFLFTEDD
tara:strand:+ start:37 stop:279 length:243 start_codon:yes stop_codon:yes gene_type:complete